MNFRVLLTLILLAGSVMAQTSAVPGPEVKKLDYFVGTWTGEGTVPAGPWGAGGKYSVTHTQKWMAGKFFLESRSETKMPSELGGETISIGFVGYDTEKKIYTSTGFDSHGGHGVELGTLDGDTWTWTGSEDYKGQQIQHRETNKMLSPTTYIAKFEVSTDGTTWTPMMETRVTKK